MLDLSQIHMQDLITSSKERMIFSFVRLESADTSTTPFQDFTNHCLQVHDVFLGLHAFMGRSGTQSAQMVLSLTDTRRW